jgi:ABC-2 type transport system permease protein
LLFGLPFDPVHPFQFVVALPSLIFGLGAFPVWLATGVIVPLSLLPGWTSVIGWVLAPTWGFRAVRNSVFGGPVWPSIGMCFALSAVYFVIAAWLMDVFEKRARERATLSLV